MRTPYRIRGRVLLGYLLLFFAIAVILTVKTVWDEEPAPVPDALTLVVPYAILLALLMRPLGRAGGSLASLLGPAPDATSWQWAVEAGVALVGVSVACFFAVYLPVSYVAPGFVESWILDAPNLVYRSGEHLLVANLIGLASLVVIAPFVEELLFRGLLLPAWAARWGAGKAVVVSSLVFALLHPNEPLGAFAFSAVLGIAFLVSGSLWLPFLAHAAGNLTVWSFAVVFGEEPWTLGEFRASWWWGLVGLLVGVPLLVRVLRTVPGPRSGG
jgi:membrane protease YdiL (CAAX protease family)